MADNAGSARAGSAHGIQEDCAGAAAARTGSARADSTHGTRAGSAHGVQADCAGSAAARTGPTAPPAETTILRTPARH